MNNGNVTITDEMIACYLEGKLTEAERAAVEAYLAENEEAMDDFVMAKTELAYSEMIKRLVSEGILLDEKIQRRRKIRMYVVGGVVLAIVAAVSFWIWRISTPLHMKVNLTEDPAYSIPRLPFSKGELRLEYADNPVQTFPLNAENKTVFLNDIPYQYRNSQVHVVFEADGYERIDTVVPVQKAFGLVLRRNNDLGVVYGRVTDFKTETPVANALIRIQDMETRTDSSGQFRIEIPFEKQDKAQLVEVRGEGYPLWEGYFRPSSTEPWVIMLGENQ